MSRHTHQAIGWILVLLSGERKRDERGLSQSTETALLIGGALTICTIIVFAITAFVNSKMPK